MGNRQTRRQRLLLLGAATALFFGTGGYFIGKPYLVKPAEAKSCGGPAFTGNPGNNKPVGMAGEHPPGGGGSSETGDRGGSR